jgi:hypothetical protein
MMAKGGVAGPVLFMPAHIHISTVRFERAKRFPLSDF